MQVPHVPMELLAAIFVRQFNPCAVWMSGQAHLHRNRSFVMLWWKNCTTQHCVSDHCLNLKNHFPWQMLFFFILCASHAWEKRRATWSTALVALVVLQQLWWWCLMACKKHPGDFTLVRRKCNVPKVGLVHIVVAQLLCCDKVLNGHDALPPFHLVFGDF